MAKTRSSSRWLREHFNDEYVRRARQDGYRSRAVYKLKEIQQKDHVLAPGMTVIDLGAAPGGWSQFAVAAVGDQGHVIALDILPMEAITGVTFIQGDLREQAVLDQLLESLAGKPIDLVISDMAPNITGVKAVDQARGMVLAELTLDLAERCLKPGGNLLLKIFQGEGFDSLLKQLRRDFAAVATRKPKSSRSRSSELYLLARNYHL